MAISRQHPFIPAEVSRVFTMQVADYVSGFIPPRLVQRLQTEVPGISIRILPFSVMWAELCAALPHVELSQSATGTTVIQDELAARGLQRHIAMTVANWFEIPDIVARSGQAGAQFKKSSYPVCSHLCAVGKT